MNPLLYGAVAIGGWRSYQEWRGLNRLPQGSVNPAWLEAQGRKILKKALLQTGATVAGSIGAALNGDAATPANTASEVLSAPPQISGDRKRARIEGGSLYETPSRVISRVSDFISPARSNPPRPYRARWLPARSAARRIVRRRRRYAVGR